MILSSRSFFKQSFAGARLTTVDSNGNETEKAPDTIRTLFLKVEKSQDIPVIDSVFVHGKLYKASLLPMEKEGFVGRTRFDNQPVYLKNTSRQVWFALQLVPLDVPSAYQSDKKIFVKGSVGKQPFRLAISNETELLPDVRM